MLGENPIRVNESGNGKSVFQLVIFHAMPAQQHRSGFADLVDASLDDLPQDGKIHAFQREPHQIHGGFGLPAHGVDIAQGIGCGNLPEPVRVIHNGREKIHRLDQGQFVGYSIHSCIVGLGKTH